ncbi:ABC transporter substrate-binding protein [Gilvimarinus sp. DA14]|uniref:substrate-binding periplasmic protein n=1 Tax=Gilvimarinus sp. DA14 TaxID=2956798 RepID=UPI0020B7CAB5|nr:transporter substrate-binding domain-containing protein [Gilvimarinus sp. DA14]UTF58642.1 transporter substrate-binding domain-containing protein [Gilvimarinus sp. DA14]
MKVLPLRAGRRSLIVLLLFCFSPWLRAQSITLVADYWCPYNCEPGSEAPGFMIEIAEGAFAAHGVKVDYRVMPWLRALHAVQKGALDGVIGASKIEAPGFVFPAMAQGRMRNGFWVAAPNPWTYSGVESLQNVRLGVIGGYSYGEEIEAYIQDPANAAQVTVLSGEDPLLRGASMLLRNRLDVLLEDEQVMRHWMAEHNFQSRFSLAGSARNSDIFSQVYVAFSPAGEKSAIYAQWLTDYMEKARRSGELAAILQKYGISDWQ